MKSNARILLGHYTSGTNDYEIAFSVTSLWEIPVMTCPGSNSLVASAPFLWGNYAKNRDLILEICQGITLVAVMTMG